MTVSVSYSLAIVQLFLQTVDGSALLESHLRQLTLMATRLFLHTPLELM